MRKLLGLGLLFSAALAVACGGDSVTGPYVDAAGIYLLKFVDGKSLPTTLIQDATGTVEVSTGSLMLSAAKTFRETLTVSLIPTDGPAQHGAVQEFGSYELVGDSLVFTTAEREGRPSTKFFGSLRGDTLRYKVTGWTVMYLHINAGSN